MSDANVLAALLGGYGSGSKNPYDSIFYTAADSPFVQAGQSISGAAGQMYNPYQSTGKNMATAIGTGLVGALVGAYGRSNLKEQNREITEQALALQNLEGDPERQAMVKSNPRLAPVYAQLRADEAAVEKARLQAEQEQAVWKQRFDAQQGAQDKRLERSHKLQLQRMAQQSRPTEMMNPIVSRGLAGALNISDEDYEQFAKSSPEQARLLLQAQVHKRTKNERTIPSYQRIEGGAILQPQEARELRKEARAIGSITNIMDEVASLDGMRLTGEQAIKLKMFDGMLMNEFRNYTNSGANFTDTEQQMIRDQVIPSLAAGQTVDTLINQLTGRERQTYANIVKKAIRAGYDNKLGQMGHVRQGATYSEDTLARLAEMSGGTFDFNSFKGAGDYNQGRTATNPATGEKLIFRNGKWESM
jgi:hypothetical protein